jgi:phosphoglycerate dehydrogenase-like enzyme
MSEAIEVLITIPFPDVLVQPLREISSRLNISLTMARKVEEVAPDVWARTEVLYTDRVLPDPAQVPCLRWIQFHYAGIDHAVNSPILQKPGMMATNLSGAAVPQVGEYAVMMMLALGHRLPSVMDNQARAEWPRDRWDRFTPFELRGATVGLVGYGSVNRQVARLLQPFGVTILAAKRDAMHPYDSGYTIDGLGDPQGDFFTRLYPYQALQSMLKECDFVVVAVPLTPATHGLMGAAELAVMKPTAFLIDLARGGVIDQPALIHALYERKIAGAALDVFTQEPLLPDSPLWQMPNVIVTPHICGISQHYDERAMTLFGENLNRYLVGLPLYNQFDPQIGY